MGKPVKRFSYLLLDEGEFYVQDWMAVCRSGPNNTELHHWPSQRVKGRLRLCSKSVFFEPDNIILPIIMFPFNKIKTIDGGSEPLMSPSPANSKWSRRQEDFVLETTLFVSMKESGFDAPYVFVKQESKWWFSLEFASVQQFLSQSQSFLSISRLPIGERDMILSNSMAQKEARGRFDTTRLHDLSEEIYFDYPAAQITPLVREPGRLVLTQSYLYFQPLHNINNDSPVRSHPLSSIITIARRRHALRHIGIEIFFSELDAISKSTPGIGLTDGGSAFFTFRNVEERNDAFASLMKQIEGSAVKVASIGSFLEADSPWLQNVMRAWQDGKISNFDYLIYLNLAAGRTFCDLTQWPVMPWILKDYTSDVLDLKNSEVFRDLSKPIGALNEERLKIFKERYAQMAVDGGPDLPFLYGTHYSTPGYVLYWLVRVAPAHMLRLQNGRFDAPDRLFVSIAESWDSVINNPADVKELIPEFFSPPGGFLLIRDGLNLGVRQCGDVVSDVKLPPWCENPRDFIRIHREAMESEHVSRNLHLWIDLIFGYKQRGEAALAADNVFHHLTYEGSVDLEASDDPVQRASWEAQINEFGQAPQQLFSGPHPARVRGCTEPNTATKDFDVILYKEVFRGLKPKYLLHVMSVATNDYQLYNNRVMSPVSPIIEFPINTSQQSGQSINDAAKNGIGNSIEERFSRLASLPTSAEQKLFRIASEKCDYSSWEDWSPASNCGIELKEKDLQPIKEDFHLKEGFENSLLISKRAASGVVRAEPDLSTSNSHEMTNSTETKQKESKMSPHPFFFKERIKLRQSLSLHRGPVKAMVLSEENGSVTLYSVGQDGFIKVFSVQEHSQVRSTKLGTLPLSSLALIGSCDKHPTALVGSNDNCLYAYSVEYGRPVGKIRVHEDTVTCIRSIDHSQRVITGSSDATVKIWTMEEGRGGWTTGFITNTRDNEAASIPENQFLEHESAVLSLDVQNEGSFVVSGDEDGIVLGWDFRSPLPCGAVWQHRDTLQGPVVGIRMIKNSPYVVVASEEGDVHLFDLRKGGSCVTTYDCQAGLKCIETSDEVILAGSTTGSLFITAATTDIAGKIEDDACLSGGSFIEDHVEAITSICISGSSNMTTASDDGSVHLYSL